MFRSKEHLSGPVYSYSIVGYQHLYHSAVSLPFALIGYCFYRRHEIALAVETLC